MRGHIVEHAWRVHAETCPRDVLANTGALAPADPAYARGVAFLLGTQADNGSWRVTSRAPKFQAYFNSGFPCGGDQWIGAGAGGGARMALPRGGPAAPPRGAQ